MRRPPTLVSLFLAVLMLVGLGCNAGGVAVYSIPITPTAQPTRADTATPYTDPSPTQTPPTPTQAPTHPLMPPLSCVVAAEALHVRACAGVACPVLDWLPQGATITPTGTKAGTWWEVTTPAGMVGWIYAEFITCP